MKRAQEYLGAKPIPNGLDLVQQGISAGNQITMGVSAFCKHHGVASELEYKLKMARAGRTMTALTIGLTDWPETKKGLELIFKETADRGFYIDRFIIALDRLLHLDDGDLIFLSRFGGVVQRDVAHALRQLTHQGGFSGTEEA